MMIILKHCIKIDLYMIDIHINAILLGKKIQNMSCWGKLIKSKVQFCDVHRIRHEVCCVQRLFLAFPTAPEGSVSESSWTGGGSEETGWPRSHWTAKYWADRHQPGGNVSVGTSPASEENSLYCFKHSQIQISKREKQITSREKLLFHSFC